MPQTQNNSTPVRFIPWGRVPARWRTANGEVKFAGRWFSPQFYRGLEAKLASAQRAHKKARVRAIHAKIANRRKDSLHQFSTRLVREYGAIFVGNVKASTLAKTAYAKSVLDAGWSAFRTMLRYKCDFAGATFAEVDEAFSTLTCSACDSRSGPKGIAGLGIRVAANAKRSTTAT